MSVGSGGFGEEANPEILQCPMTLPAPARSVPRQAGAPADAAAKAALAWLHGARFVTTASRLEQLPPDEGPEIAFVGRSNAGKSSAINRLAQQRRLAFASRTPGRTQHINLFALGPMQAPDALLADLPGYGYAAVERAAKLRWQEVMANYLAARRSLSGVVLLADARLGLTELDERLIALLRPRLDGGVVRLLLVLTKADKLSRAKAADALRASIRQLGALLPEGADAGVVLFSALDGTGVADVATTLRGWAEAARSPAQTTT
jgi:GTP-binding protein